RRESPDTRLAPRHDRLFGRRSHSGSSKSSVGCSLELATKNGSSERGARHSAVNHELDRVDVRRIVGSKKKHSFGQILWLAPTAKWNRGREEVGKLCGLLLSGIGARPALPNRSLRRARRDDIHPNVARRKVRRDRSCHRDEATLRGSVCGGTGLAEMVMYRSIEDDAGAVVQQRSGGVDGEESAIQVGADNILKRCFVRRAGRRPAANSGIDEDDVQLPEILGNIREEPLPVVRHGNVGAIAARVGSQFGDCFIQRFPVPASNRDFGAFCNEEAGSGQADAAVSPGDEGLLACEFHNSSLMTGASTMTTVIYVIRTTTFPRRQRCRRA